VKKTHQIKTQEFAFDSIKSKSALVRLLFYLVRLRFLRGGSGVALLAGIARQPGGTESLGFGCDSCLFLCDDGADCSCRCVCLGLEL
jgi:hypothetical protein